MFSLLKSQTQLITEIHAAFDSAEDKLLQQANAVLQELAIPTQSSIERRADLSKQLGFVNTPVVKRAETLNRSVSVNRELAELIRHYKQVYPFQKFLTEEELNRICEKYHLIYAPIARYTRDVPLKNLEEISAAAPLRAEDGLGVKWYVRVREFWSDCPQAIRTLLQGEVEYNGTVLSWGEVSERDLMAVVRQLGYTGQYDHYIFKKATLRKIDKSGLFIAAPKSHFDLKGLGREGKFGFFSITTREIKDPIVFRYCKGGIQVLSKWGLEGEDAALVNEKLN